jgi:hypothetical protein
VNRLAAALLCAGCTGGGGGGLPETDTCSSPMIPQGAFTVDLGDAGGPWADGEVVSLETGGQGFRMLAVRTYLDGASIPGCVMQDLDLDVDGRDAGGALHNLPFRRTASGLWAAEPVYVVVFGAYPGAEIVVTVTVGGRSASRRVYADQRPAPDAG